MGGEPPAGEGRLGELLHRSHLLGMTNHLWVRGRELLDPCLSRRVVDLIPGGLSYT
ncbi:MAG: hypothetical protein ACLFPN_04865 [Methanomassiliicoccales archaeon]